MTVTKHNREAYVLVRADRFKAMEEALRPQPVFAHEVSDELAAEIEVAEYGK
ncbi:hypothetical protein V5T82_04530 [Magnetovibrio sp. PR-2]|uniref:hypothetical protein n=1 Tax=Magnetovibrio sp. PR-2 TaxID=3120356 RepID=UPI002FCE5B7E